MRKRILSLFMALVMLFSLTTPAAWAAEDPAKDSAVTNGSYGETGTTWTEGGTGTIQYKPDDNTTLNLSKTATVIGENEFEITLTVQARTKTQLSTNAAAVVLVIDTSGSMRFCAECGGDGRHDSDCDHYTQQNNTVTTAQSRMQAAKNAALSFLATYAGTDANAARWLSIVDFDDDGDVVQDWINVAGGAGKNGYNTAVSKINALAQGGGTNLDDGLYDANTQMGKTTVSGITAKSVIALTDGAPTRSRSHGNGYYGSADINSDTAATAATLRGNADLYTVCFGVANEVTYEGSYGRPDGPTVGNFLQNSVATPAAGDTKYAYNADNTAELMAAFRAITNDITAGIESKTVNDPMGKDVAVPTLPSVPGVTGSSTALTWELQDTAGVKDGDYTVYTYTLTYQVELDATVEGFDENAWHPANGVTTLNWGDGQTFAFPVPGLKGVIPVFTVKYQQGEHGVLMDGDTVTAEIVHSNLKMHTATPAEPEVKAADGYYFTGWSPVVADTVTEDVTYVAQYAPKTVITVTANSDSKEYNGAAQSVEDYTVAGLDDGYVLSGLTATVSGTNVGTYTNAVTGTPVITKDGVDVTEQFTVNTKNGTLTITKKALTITADSASKVYDGTPLTKDTYTVSGLAEGDSVSSVTITGTQTAVGTANNVPSDAKIVDGDEDVTGNYNITYVNGKLTVTELEGVIVTIKENSGSFTYNGGEQSVTGYEIVKIESKDNLYTKDDFKFNGDATVKGTDVGTYNMALTPSNFQNTNPNFKDVQFVIEDGTLVINKKDVTITSATDSKDYDGTALTNSTVTAEGFVEGEGATYDVTGTRTEVGTSDNTFTYTLNANTKASNYNITTKEGTLTVNPLGGIVVTIVGNTGTKTYNGAEQSVVNYNVTINNTLYKVSDFTFSGDATAKGTNVGTYAMGLTVDQFTNKNSNFKDVTFNVTDGWLKIDRKDITVTADDKTKVYGTDDPELTATVDGLVDDAEIEYKLSRAEGEDVGEYTITVAGAAEQGNYTVTYVPGTLTITPVTDKVTVTITEHSGDAKYDGTEKTVSGYDVAISNTLYTEADFTFGGDATIKGTDADTYNMELKPADFTNESPNFTNVEFVIVDGTLDIAKREVTLTSADDEKVYDSTALTNDEVTVSGDGFVEGEGATYDVTGTQTNVGESKNTFTYTLNEGTKAANYDITTVEGTLEVTPVTDEVIVTITEHSGDAKYDGEEKTVTGYDVAIDNELYTVNDFTFGGDATIKGTDAGSYDMELTAADFTNTSINFTNVTFVIVDGTLEIAKREVTLTSADDAKVYDGTPLTNNTVTVSGDGFAEGEGAAYDVTGSQTAKGESKNTFTYTLNEGTKADNYVITTVEGTLKVTAAGEVVVTITEHSGSELYDGTEKTVTGYDVDISNELYTESDFTFKGDATIKGTDAGSYSMELKAEDFVNNSTNFSKVTFVIVDGTLEIAKRNVTLTSADDEKVYDGKALTNDTVTVTGDGFAEGEGAAYDVTGTRTEVGNNPNAFTYTLNEGTKAENYNITKVEGTLTVTPLTDKVTVTITENSGTEKYDGAEKTVTGYTVSIDNALYTESDFTFSGTDSVSGTDAGTYNMELKAEDFANISKNFSNVEFVIVDGTLVITKRAVTLTSADAEQVYNGNALTNSTVSVSGDGFADGEGASYDVTGSQTEVGESKNAFTYTLSEGTKADNYVIETVEGTLTVTPVTDKVTVTITEHSGEYVYDSTEKTVSGYDVAISNPLYTEEDFTFDGNDSVSGTDVNTYNMELTAEDFQNVSKNFANVEFVIVDGQLVITKKPVTITAGSATKVYDGTELICKDYTAEGLAEGDTVDSVAITGSQTVVGKSDNVADVVVIMDGTKVVTNNYEVTYVKGTLEVTPVTDEVVVTITEHSGEYTYDASEKTVTGYDVTSISNDLYTVADFTFSGTDSVSGINAGTYDMALTAEDFANISKNFANVKFVIVDGQLTINKMDLTITAASGEKIYDGTPLTDAGYDNTVLALGDAIESVSVVGSQTFVGSSANVASDAKLVNAAGEDVTANYDITYVDGTLTVTKKGGIVVTITENSGEYTYDATEKTVEGYTVAINSTLYTVEDFTFSGEAIVKGTDAGLYPMELKAEDFANVNENFEDVTFVIVDGTLGIKARPITVTVNGNTDTKVYNGAEQSVEGYTVDIADTLYTEEDIAFTGEAVAKGTDVGTYAMGLTTEQFSNTNENFIVTFVVNDGSLEITPLTGVVVTITENSGEFVYDGTVKTVEGYTVATSSELYTEADFTFSGNDSVSGTYVGAYDMELKAEDFANINDNFADVIFQIVDGQLVITPVQTAIVITADSNEKVYDGTALTDDGFTYTQGVLMAGDYITAVVEGSQTDVGSSANVVTSYKVLRDTGAVTREIVDVTANYANITTEDGTLTVTKRPVTLTSGSDSKVYDGTALTKEEVTVTGDGFVEGEGAAYSQFASITEAGSTNNTFTYTLTEGTKADNYDITVVEGVLTVTKKGGIVVTITENSGEYTYDATEKTVEGYTVAINSTLYTEDDFTFSGEAIVKGTDAGLYPMELTKDDFKNVNENFEDVTFVIVDGTLVIKARPITVTINGNTDTKVYNGAEQSVEGYTVDIADTLYTEEDIAFTGEAVAKGTDVGTYAMGLTTEQFSNTNENFIVTFVVNDGSLEITPLTGVVVTITENSGEFVYDGTVKTVEGYTVATSSELYTEADFTFSGNDSVSGTYVGAYDMELKAEDFANINDNFADVIFQIVDGQLVITPVQTAIVITADSNEKVYDGTALTDDGFTYTQGVLMAGDYITAVVEGSQTDVGSSANVVTSYKVLRDTGAVTREIVDVTANYANITTEDGTLTVTKRPVTLTSGSDSKVYDGTALTKEEVTVTGDGFVEGEGAEYSQFASITEVGSTDNTFTYTLTEGTKADNYDITVVEGVLTVNKHTDAKLEATGYTGVYDGQLHDGVTDKAVVDGVEGDEWTYTYSIDGENFTAEMPQYQDVGTYTVYVKASNPNYEGDALTTTVPVVITPATIVVTADDHTIATGDPEPELTYQVSTPVATETPAFDGILVREEGNAKGEYAIEQGTLVLVDGEGFKASNYVLEYVPGTLTILQRAIDVEKTVDVEKAFVGDTITYTFVVTNTGEVDLETVVLVDEMLQIAGEIGALAIGESWTGTATYVAAAEDVGKTLINTVIVAAEGDTTDQDDSEGTVIYAPVPQTGDEMPLGLLSGAMLVSLAGVIVLLLTQRKNKADQAE